MNWQTKLNGDPLPWLLEPEDPGVRYLALEDLLNTPKDDPQFLEAEIQAYAQGPIASLLDAMDETSGACGIMHMTWYDNYDEIEEFADVVCRRK